MFRSIVAAMCVVVAVAAPSSGAATPDARSSPSADSYIVVLNPDSARSASERPSSRALVATVAESSPALTAARSRSSTSTRSRASPSS